MKQDKKQKDIDLDLDSILQQHGISLDMLNELSEEMRPKVLKSYIESQLRFIEKEEKSRWTAPKELITEREEHLITALEYAAQYESLDSLLQRAMPIVDSTFRSKLQPWDRMNTSSTGIGVKKFRKDYLAPYLSALARLQTIGYSLSELEALQLILDDLAEEMRKDTERNRWRAYDQHSLLYRSNHKKLRFFVGLFEEFEKKSVTPNKQALLDYLYGLFLRPQTFIHYPIDYYPPDKVVLCTFEEAAQTLEERFVLLERLEKKGYPIDYQQAAEPYVRGLKASDFTAEKDSLEMTEASRRVLERLDWLGKKCVDFSEKYKQLANDVTAHINEGGNPQRYLPLLEFLTKHEAFDTGQLALLKAISAPQHI